MKKILTVLAVAMIAANLSGCCCRRLCPWLDRGAYCGPSAPLFSPLASTVSSVMPTYQPAYQPAYQYAAPLAATNQCCAPTPNCATWDPCQGQVNYGYPQAMPAANYAAPCCTTATADPGCAYMDPSMMGASYGPVITSGCDTCGTGYSGQIIASPMPQQVIPATPGPSQATAD